MKIGIDARMYGPKQTGIGNYIKYLITHLAQIDQANDYYIFLGSDEYGAVTFHNPRFHKMVSAIPWYSLAEQVVFARQLLSLSLDIMHFPHFNASMLYRRPFVVTIHDLTPRLFPGEKIGKSWVRRQGYNMVVRNAVRSSRMIISPSQFTKQDIIRSFAIPESKIEVVYEGVPLPAKHPGKALLSTPYILYVGVWRSHKNLAGLIRALALLKEQKLPHKLVLVGDPDIYYQPLKNLWESLGLAERVVCVGFQDDKALGAWYNHASLLVLPSFSEGFGLTPLISLSYGVPVAVSDIPVLREVLGGAAFYFNPHDPGSLTHTLAQVLVQPSLAKDKLALVPSLLKNYRWDTMAHHTLALYKKSADLH